MDTAAFLTAHCRRYPQLQLQDCFKALYQSVYGGGHLVTDPADAAARIAREAAACSPDSPAGAEELDGAWRRVHLRGLFDSGLRPETLAKLFAASSAVPSGSDGELEEKLSVLLSLAEAGRVPFSPEETAAEIVRWREAGFPALHHSEAFRAAYAPAYRVLRREHAALLPLLAAIDRKLAERERVLLAIDGGSGSGKTTLAALLEQLFDAEVFHMDDFYLRVEQRTPARYAEPGGNVDRERFAEEVLLPLRSGAPSVRYRPFDIATWTVGEGTERQAGALNVIEGAYSMHPALAARYDLSVFLDIAPEAQRRRIQNRNTPESQVLFFSRWIPLERAYFAALDPKSRCDFVLEVEA